MKRYIYGLLFLCMILTNVILSQNVGINEENPQGKVHIKSNSSISMPQLRLTEVGSDFSRLKFENTQFAAYWDIAGYPTDDATGSRLHFYFNNGVNAGDRLTIDGLGKVGIRVPNPEAKLDILGGSWNLESGSPGDLRLGNSTHNLRIGVATGGGGAGIGRIFTSSHLFFGTDSTLRMVVTKEGKVGIGTNNPTTDLDVNGILRIRDMSGSGNRNLMVNSNGEVMEGTVGVGDTDWTETPDLVKSTKPVLVETSNTSYSGLAITGVTSNGNNVSALAIWNKGGGFNVPYYRMLIDANDIDSYRANGSSEELNLCRNSNGNLGLVKGGGNVGIGLTATDSKVTIEHFENNGIRAALRIGTSNPLLLDRDELDVTGLSLGLLINSNSNKPVAIGTKKFAAGYKLSVEGKIMSDEIRVQIPTLWPDYVFAEDYPLMPLENLKEAIDSNGHLPGIPNASTVESEGIELGDMQVKVMEKIEELTLYMIQLNEENKALKKRIEELEKTKN